MDSLMRGCLYGSVFGDACGAPFELKRTVPLKNVLNFFYLRLTRRRTDILRYTDDTEMALCICYSLKRMNGFNPRDLAIVFSYTFDHAPPCRLYGGSIRQLFQKMKANNFANPIVTAASQFNGEGSFGNGGAMRITTAVLYALNFSKPNFNRLILGVTAVTHNNAHALYATLFQAHVLRRLMRLSRQYGAGFRINIQQLIESCYIDSISDEVIAYDMGRPDYYRKIASRDLYDKLEIVKAYARAERCPSVSEVVAYLGNSEAAMESVPTALYVFLRCLKPMPEIPYDNLMIKCSAYASSLGFDTDTIGCMACAMAGAYLGAERIERFSMDRGSTVPVEIFKRVEGLETINYYSDWLIQRYNSQI